MGFEYVRDPVPDMANKFQREATFEGLIGIGGRRLKYDFKVFLNSVDFVIIEYDGMGHEGPVTFGGCTNAQAKKSYDTTHRHDLIKHDFCRWE